MQPLNLAVLKLYAKTGEELCLRQVKERLKDDYGDMGSFNDKNLTDVLLCGKENMFLDEVFYEINEDGKLDIFYKANEEQRKMINKYVPD